MLCSVLSFLLILRLARGLPSLREGASLGAPLCAFCALRGIELSVTDARKLIKVGVTVDLSFFAKGNGLGDQTFEPICLSGE